MSKHDHKTKDGKRKGLWHFLSEGVWDIELSSLSARHRFGVSFIRVMHLVLKGYRDDDCPLHAAALTFHSLMAIVPVLAISLSIAKGLGAGDFVQERIRETVHSQIAQFQDAHKTEVVSEASDTSRIDPDELLSMIDSVVEKVFSYAARINFAALGGLGLGLLLWSVISVLKRVELSFNRIWGVTAPRTLPRQFADYLGVLILAPLLIILSSSLPVIDKLRQLIPGHMQHVLSHLGASYALQHIMVVVLVSVSFALFIMIMPNTRVRFSPAFGGGLLAALLFIGWVWICVRLEVGALSAGKLYGSLAVIPILLFWVLISWQIVLLGTVVAFAVQNCATYRLEKTARNASAESRVILALSIVSEAAQLMKHNEGPFDSTAFSVRNQVPVRLLNTVLQELCEAGYLIETAKPDGGYVLLRSPDDIKKNDIVEAIMKAGTGPDELGLDRLAAASEKLLSAG